MPAAYASLCVLVGVAAWVGCEVVVGSVAAPAVSHPTADSLADVDMFMSTDYEEGGVVVADACAFVESDAVALAESLAATAPCALRFIM